MAGATTPILVREKMSERFTRTKGTMMMMRRRMTRCRSGNVIGVTGIEMIRKRVRRSRNRVRDSRRAVIRLINGRDAGVGSVARAEIQTSTH